MRYAAGAAMSAAARVGRNYVARKVGDSITGNKRPRTENKDEVTAVGSPVTYKTVKRGRAEKHSVAAAWRHIAALDERVNYRYQGLTDYSAPQGWYIMDRIVAGTPPLSGATQNLPLYLFDLSCVPQNGSAPNQLQMVGARMLAQSTGSGNNVDYKFTTVLSQAGSGAAISGNLTTNQWLLDNSGAVVNGPGRADILKWLDIRLICIGGALVPTTFEISIISLNNDWLHPAWASQTNSSQGDNYQWGVARNAFWENEVNRFISSPITVINPQKSRGCTRHYVTKFTIQPKDTSSSMTEPAHKIFKLFQHLNRVQRYDWAQPSVVASSTANTQFVAGEYPLNSAANNGTDVEPRKRLYLMIKATNQYPAGDNSVAPSFDLVMRKCHVGPAAS